MVNEHRSTAPTTPRANLADSCSLSTDALEDRLAMIRREIQPHASTTQELENGIAWDFDATPEMKAKLEDLARLERQCCSELDFEVWENPSRTRLRFEISGADPKTGFFDALSLSHPTGDTAAPGRWPRLLKRGGLAALASFVVCCVIPAALVSFAGISIAAPLMKLDDPLVIAAGALLFATLLWLHDRRRSNNGVALSTGKGDGCGC
jgi:hypothetical protein